MDQINGFVDIIEWAHLVIVENTSRKGYSESVEILIDGKRMDLSGVENKGFIKFNPK